MPLNKHNQRHFHRGLFAGQLESVVLHKRGDNQRQGEVTDHLLFECRWGPIHKTGETIDRHITAGDGRLLHIPRSELDRVGVSYLNPTDYFDDEQGRSWQPEATTSIDVRLFELHVDVFCLALR